MKGSTLAFSILLVSSLFSCKKNGDTADDEAPQDINLIVNPSFEFNKVRSTAYWNVTQDYANFPDTFNIAPPKGGGLYALQLSAKNAPAPKAEAVTYISNLEGNKEVQLSSKVKVLSGTSTISLYLTQIRSGVTIKTAFVNQNNIGIWADLNLKEHFNLQATDSLKVRFVQNNTLSSSCAIDLVKLIAK